MDSADVVIVGAGAAGLMAAHELAASGLSLRVLEARDRVGGRILGVDDPRAPIPIELGAEFIHGDAPLTGRLLAEAGLSSLQVPVERRLARRGRLSRVDAVDIDRVLRRAPRDGPDPSLAAFLARRPGGRALARPRTFVRRFVEGYHSADADRVSVQSLLPDEQESAAASATEIGRVTQGYGALARWLARGLGRSLRLGHEVRSIAWRRGHVTVEACTAGGRAARVSARAAIVAVPIAVLAAHGSGRGAIAFEPDPPALRRALAGLATGSVVRLVLSLRSLPWEGGCDRERPVTFLQFASGPFQAAWSCAPWRWPLAVLWCGGPDARALSKRPAAEVRRVMTAQLAAALGTTARRLEQDIRHLWWHNWERDPHARGAYSYVAAGGAAAAAAIRRPVDSTLFFAGEATEDARGTVEAALTSGRRAARRVRDLLGRARPRRPGG